MPRFDTNMRAGPTLGLTKPLVDVIGKQFDFRKVAACSDDLKVLFCNQFRAFLLIGIVTKTDGSMIVLNQN